MRLNPNTKPQAKRIALFALLNVHRIDYCNQHQKGKYVPWSSLAMDNQLALGFFKATAASSYLRYLASGAFSLSSPSQQDALVLVSLGMIAVGVFPCSAP